MSGLSGKKIGMIAAAALAAGAIGVAAGARDAVSTTVGGDREITVDLSGLDLTRSEGAEAALRRIERAAKQACGAPSGRSLMDIRVDRECVASATAGAVADLGAPLVTALLEQTDATAYAVASAE